MSGLLKLIVGVFTLLILAGMLTVIFLLSRPGEIPEIDGKEAIAAGKVKQEKLLDRMKLAFNSKEKFVVTEEQLNHYLASKLSLTQGGKADTYIDIKGIWVDLREDWMDFYIEREVKWGGGKNEKGEVLEPQTQLHVTKFGFKIETIEHADKSLEKRIAPGAGKIGSSPLPGLFGKLAKAPLEKVAECFTEELELFSKMVQMRVFEGKLELSSKENTVSKPASEMSSSGKQK